MNISQHLQKWGNGTGVRLPQKLIKAANWRDNQMLTVELRGASVVLTPAKPAAMPTIDELLKDVTPDLVGGELDWGADKGRERL